MDDSGGFMGLPPVDPGRPFDELALDTPNCPVCLLRMQVAEATSGEPYWECTGCGFVALA